MKIDTIISGFFLNHSSSIRLCLVQVAQLFFGLASTIMLLFGFYFYLADCPFGIAFDALFVPYILAVSVSYKTLWIAELSFSCENLITFQSFKFKKDISSPHVSFISYLSLYIFEVESPQCSELDNFSWSLSPGNQCSGRIGASVNFLELNLAFFEWVSWWTFGVIESFHEIMCH